MSTLVASAMSVCTDIFAIILAQPELAILAVGFPVIRAGSGALKRVIKV